MRETERESRERTYTNDAKVVRWVGASNLYMGIEATRTLAESVTPPKVRGWERVR